MWASNAWLSSCPQFVELLLVGEGVCEFSTLVGEGALEPLYKPGKTPADLRFRSGSFQFSPSRDLRFWFRVLTASRLRMHVYLGLRAVDLVVLWDYLVADPRMVRDLHSRGVPHLPVRVRDGTGLVGPLVIPGITNCLGNP
jgi:hypothetical protein